MRIAIYGGSFNPPHRAHAMVIGWLLESEIADQVWLVPVYRHAFEASNDKILAPYADRLRWCEALALPFSDRVQVSDVERTPARAVVHHRHPRSPVSTHPMHQFRLVVGADILGQVGRLEAVGSDR